MLDCASTDTYLESHRLRDPRSWAHSPTATAIAPANTLSRPRPMLSALPPPLVPVGEGVVPGALVVAVDESLPFAFLLLPVYDTAWTPVPLVQVPGLTLDEKVMSAHCG